MKKMCERDIGLHVRITDSLTELIDRARRLQISTFQLFLVEQNTRRIFTFSAEEILQFRILREAYFDRLYMHGSYLVNLAGIRYNGMQILYKEISLAKKLGFTDIVLHSGSAHGARDRRIGIDMVARMLNKIVRHEKELTFILENTAHGNMSVGSDITDFYYIRQKLDAPERIRFCVDTSHAHVYGYDLIDSLKKEEFIRLLDECMGIENISLIHLNDTGQRCGSRIDKHDPLGKGVLGIDVLKNFAMDDRFAAIPLIMELPLMDEHQEKFFVNMIEQWHKK